jgi:hypothetical protein
MDTKSGVYWTLDDQSVRAGGGSTFGGIVPMFTVKGAVGKRISVTARNYQDILGWKDTASYVGLDSMLQSVTRLEVLRMNRNTYLDNICWLEDDSNASCTDAVTPDSLEGFLSNDKATVSYIAHAVPGKWGNFEVKVTSPSAGLYRLDYRLQNASQILLTREFSFDPAEDNFYKKVDFGDLVLWFSGDVVSTGFTASLGTWILLAGGAEGSHQLTAVSVGAYSDIIARSDSNVIVLNGLTQDIEIINKFIGICDELGTKSVFIDVPDFTGVGVDSDMEFTVNDGAIIYSECEDWVKDLTPSENAQVVAVPDRSTTDSGVVYIWPSVNLFKIYAQMYSDHGNVNYPPAGYTYGVISVSNLMDSDFDLYGDELKTNRINYQMIGPRGSVMWEQRTLYPLNSDLSYANTVHILRDIKYRVMEFMSNFNFRYSTPMDLLNIASGLDSILGEAKRNLFLVNYVLEVPSFEEAQAAGRELEILIDVSVINDMEVIRLKVNLQNASTLRAA